MSRTAQVDAGPGSERSPAVCARTTVSGPPLLRKIQRRRLRNFKLGRGDRACSQLRATEWVLRRFPGRKVGKEALLVAEALLAELLNAKRCRGGATIDPRFQALVKRVAPVGSKDDQPDLNHRPGEQCYVSGPKGWARKASNF